MVSLSVLICQLDQANASIVLVRFGFPKMGGSFIWTLIIIIMKLCYIYAGVYILLWNHPPPPSRKSNFPPIFIPNFWSVHTSPRENFRKFYEKDRNTAYHYNSYSKLTIRAKRRNVFNIYDEIGGKNPEIEKWGNKLWL